MTGALAKTRIVFLGAVLAIAGAQGVRLLAKAERDKDGAEEPFAPSAGAAPIVSLGYRELAADIFFFRLVGYFGDRSAAPQAVAALVEAIVAMDPHHPKIYEWGGRAIVAARHGDNTTALRAIAILERGLKIFPGDYKLPKLAGEIYLFDLRTKDPEQKREWNEKGARLIESAIRKPGAPAELGTLVAHMQTKLGHRQRALDGLRELILITPDQTARAQLLEKLAELQQSDTSELAAELLDARQQFEAAWKRERPSVPSTMYTIVGPITPPGFDMRDLATGGRELIIPPERLEPLTDPPADPPTRP